MSNDDKSQPAAPKKYVVLVDNHTHAGKPMPKGTVLDNVVPSTAAAYPAIFGEEGSPAAAKALKEVAEAKAAAEKIANDAKAPAAESTSQIADANATKSVAK